MKDNHDMFMSHVMKNHYKKGFKNIYVHENNSVFIIKHVMR